jgi:hypothetical protein
MMVNRALDVGITQVPIDGSRRKWSRRLQA